MEKLEPPIIEEKMVDFPEWSVNADTLQRTFRFEDFEGAMSFVNRIAQLAEELAHHPDIMIRSKKVTLTLTTHDANGLTEKDFQFARATDEFVAMPSG